MQYLHGTHAHEQMMLNIFGLKVDYTEHVGSFRLQCKHMCNPYVCLTSHQNKGYNICHLSSQTIVTSGSGLPVLTGRRTPGSRAKGLHCTFHLRILNCRCQRLNPELSPCKACVLSFSYGLGSSPKGSSENF